MLKKAKKWLDAVLLAAYSHPIPCALAGVFVTGVAHGRFQDDSQIGLRARDAGGGKAHGRGCVCARGRLDEDFFALRDVRRHSPHSATGPSEPCKPQSRFNETSSTAPANSGSDSLGKTVNKIKVFKII